MESLQTRGVRLDGFGFVNATRQYSSVAWLAGEISDSLDFNEMALERQKKFSTERSRRSQRSETKATANLTRLLGVAIGGGLIGMGPLESSRYLPV